MINLNVVLEKLGKMSARAVTEFGLSVIDMDLRQESKKIKNRTLILWGSDHFLLRVES